MAGGMDLGVSKGGKKALDAAINLVPFIDLMAVTISFLIMTAVWTQIGRLRVGQSSGAGGAEAELLLPVTLLITEKELTLSVGGTRLAPLPVTRDARGRLDLAGLHHRLEELLVAQPQQQAITLLTEDDVRYDDLVRVIDECLGAGLPAIQVSPATG